MRSRLSGGAAGKSVGMEMDEPGWLKLTALVEEQFHLDLQCSAHAADHWNRVWRYGQLLSTQSGADLTVVHLFAYLHDSRREEEAHDPQHGPRAARYARHLCGKAFDLEPERLELLALACRDHDRGLTSTDATIGTCWDADRLDLDRVGVTTDPQYMSTAYGRELAGMYAWKRRKLARISDPY